MTSISEKTAELQKRLKEMRKGLQEDLQLLKVAGIGPKEIKVFHSKIGPLVKNVFPKKSLQPIIIGVLNSVRRGNDYMKEIMNLDASKNLTEKQRSLLLLFSYLALSEGIFSECVQLITFILIENHHDIYDPFRKEFVKDYKGLDKVSLYLKLQFIEKHGFKFVTDEFDRAFRNCIAHLRFIVEDDGTVVNVATGEKIEQEVLMAKNAVLYAMTLMIIHVFTKVIFLKEFFPFKQ